MKLLPQARPARPHALKLSALAAAALALPLLMPAGTAPTASAGDSRFTIKFSSHHHGHHKKRVHQPRGYYKHIWVPPVYHTRYDECGQPYKILAKKGYYKKVFVHKPHYETRHHKSDRFSRRHHRTSYRY